MPKKMALAPDTARILPLPKTWKPRWLEVVHSARTPDGKSGWLMSSVVPNGASASNEDRLRSPSKTGRLQRQCKSRKSRIAQPMSRPEISSVGGLDRQSANHELAHHAVIKADSGWGNPACSSKISLTR